MIITLDGIKMGNPYSVEMPNGKCRWFLKYYDERTEKWETKSKVVSKKTVNIPPETRAEIERRIRKALDRFELKNENLTVSEVVEQWIIQRSEEVGVNTNRGDRSVLLKFIEKFGKWKISKVETHHIQDFLTNLKVTTGKKKGQAATKGTKRNLHSKLQLLFDYCELDLHIIKSNPMDKVRTKRQSKTLEEYQKLKDKCFFEEEMDLLLEAMEKAERNENDKRKRLLIEFNYLNGPRISEALGLCWSHVNLDAKIVFFEFQYDSKASDGESRLMLTKTPQSRRTKDIDERSEEILRWFRENNSEASSSVFQKKNGRMLTNQTINEYLKSFAYILPYKLESSFSSHTLRHSFITRMAEQGTPEYEIMAMVGHANPAMIHTIYTHVRDQRRLGTFSQS